MLSLFLAGLFIAFSPCILPALPIIGATALQKNKFGPIITAAGLIFGFVLMGVVLKSIALLFSFSADLWRLFAAILLIILGLLALVSRYFMLLHYMIMPLLGVANDLSEKAHKRGLYGQFCIGMLLGVIWMPCVGPALGGVMVMIAHDPHYLSAIISLAVFGLGASIPLLLCSYGLHYGLRPFHAISEYVELVFGVILIIAGGMILFKLDLYLQALILSHLPQWWLNLITRF